MTTIPTSGTIFLRTRLGALLAVFGAALVALGYLLPWLILWNRSAPSTLFAWNGWAYTTSYFFGPNTSPVTLLVAIVALPVVAGLLAVPALARRPGPALLWTYAVLVGASLLWLCWTPAIVANVALHTAQTTALSATGFGCGTLNLGYALLVAGGVAMAAQSRAPWPSEHQFPLQRDAARALAFQGQDPPAARALAFQGQDPPSRVAPWVALTGGFVALVTFFTGWQSLAPSSPAIPGYPPPTIGPFLLQPYGQLLPLDYSRPLNPFPSLYLDFIDPSYIAPALLPALLLLLATVAAPFARRARARPYVAAALAGIGVAILSFVFLYLGVQFPLASPATAFLVGTLALTATGLMLAAPVNARLGNALLAAAGIAGSIAFFVPRYGATDFLLRGQTTPAFTDGWEALQLATNNRPLDLGNLACNALPLLVPLALAGLAIVPRGGAWRAAALAALAVALPLILGMLSLQMGYSGFLPAAPPFPGAAPTFDLWGLAATALAVAGLLLGGVLSPDRQFLHIACCDNYRDAARPRLSALLGGVGAVAIAGGFFLPWTRHFTAPRGTSSSLTAQMSGWDLVRTLPSGAPASFWPQALIWLLPVALAVLALIVEVAAFLRRRDPPPALLGLAVAAVALTWLFTLLIVPHTLFPVYQSGDAQAVMTLGGGLVLAAAFRRLVTRHDNGAAPVPVPPCP